MRRPHLIVIMADQLRYDLIGPEHTPNISALAEEGVTFPNAYCASPICVPSRGSFFTGRYPNQTGCLINPWIEADRHHGYVAEGTPNLYDLMTDSHDCRHVGKQHLCYDPPLEGRADTATQWVTLEETYAPMLAAREHRAPGGPRFRALVPELVSARHTTPGNYSAPATGCYEPGFDSFFDGHILRGTLEAIDQRDPTKPLFLSAMFLAPHPPFDIPEPWYSMVGDIPLPHNVGVWGAGQSPLQLYNLTGFVGARYSRDDWQEIWRVYAGLVRLLDHCVGEIISRLKAQGIYDDTIILFTSDHGEMLGSHCLFQKMCMYEESVRTPLILKLPGSKTASLRPERVSHIDVLPTLCELLGIPAPRHLPGRSLCTPSPKSRDIFVQYDGNGALGNFSRAIIRGADKLLVDIFKDELFFELHNLDDDPLEECNIITRQPELAATLLGSLADHMRNTGDHLQLKSDDLAIFLQERAADLPV